jgi:hypothetical protein
VVANIEYQQFKFIKLWYFPYFAWQSHETQFYFIATVSAEGQCRLHRMLIELKAAAITSSPASGQVLTGTGCFRYILGDGIFVFFLRSLNLIWSQQSTHMGF